MNIDIILKKLKLLLDTTKEIFDENNKSFIGIITLIDRIYERSGIEMEFIKNAIIELMISDFFEREKDKLKIKDY